MNASDLLNLAVQVFFVFLGGITFLDFLRHRDGRRRDVALLFGALGLVYLTQIFVRLTGFQPTWLQVFGSWMLVAQPYLLLPPARYFHPIPPLLMRTTLLTVLVFWVALALTRLFTPATALLGLMGLVAYFVAINGYAMRIFFRGAWTTTGIVRQRLRFAAAGSGLIALVLLSLGFALVVPASQPMLTSVTLLLTGAAALSFYAGFAPPRWLRQIWQLIEVRRFLMRGSQLSPAERLTVEQSINELCRAARLAVGAGMTAVIQYRPSDSDWTIRCTTQPESEALTHIATGSTLTGRLLKNPSPFYLRISDNLHEAEYNLLKNAVVDTLLVAPIMISQQVWGMVIAFLDHHSLFIEDDLDTLSLLSWQTAIFLENVGMVEELSRYSAQLEQKITEGSELYHQAQVALAGIETYAQRLDWLNEMSQQLNTALTEEAIFRIAGEFTRRILSADSYTIFLAQDDPEKLIVALSEDNGQVVRIGEVVPVSGTISGDVLLTGQTRNIGDLKTLLKTTHPTYAEAIEKTPFNSFLAVPIRASQTIIGVVGISDKKPDAYDTQDENLLLHIASFVGIAVENVRHNDELQQAILTAEKASRAKSEFLATMSHELRTPLNGILGYVQILRKDRDVTAKQREGLDIIDRSSEHLLTLINDILDLSKIEAQRMELSVAGFPLTEMLGNVCRLVQVRAEQKDLVFRYEQLTDLPAGVRGDEMRLRQVLLNLLGNAVKYTDQGGIVLKVGCQEDRIRFQVEDTGHGIEPEALKTLFQPFQQAANRNTGVEGTGLGLAISSQMIALMGGRLHVKSQPGEGSVFWFELHLPADEDFTATSAPEVEHITGYRGEIRRIMVVDDRLENRAVLSGMLVPLGFEIQEAVNGQQCLDRVAQFHPHAILMDLRMPVMDGVQTMRSLRRMPESRDTVLIAISASAFEHDEQESRAAGADDFLAKPFRLQRLLDLLGLYLKLEWMVESAAASPAEAPPEHIVAPPADTLNHLFDLARQGDIQEILNQSDHLARQGYAGFAGILRSLAQGFKLKEIRSFIEQQRR